MVCNQGMKQVILQGVLLTRWQYVTDACVKRNSV